MKNNISKYKLIDIKCLLTLINFFLTEIEQTKTQNKMFNHILIIIQTKNVEIMHDKGWVIFYIYMMQFKNRFQGLKQMLFSASTNFWLRAFRD